MPEGPSCRPPFRHGQGNEFGWWFGWAAQDEDVFVLDELEGSALGAGGADLLDLEEGAVRNQVAVADGGQERDAALYGFVAGAGGGGQGGGGEVDKLPAVAPGAGGDGEDAAGFEQGLAVAEDGGESGQELGGGLVGEVGLVAAVGVVPFGDSVAGFAFGLAVDGAAVGR